MSAGIVFLGMNDPQCVSENSQRYKTLLFSLRNMKIFRDVRCLLGGRCETESSFRWVWCVCVSV